MVLAAVDKGVEAVVEGTVEVVVVGRVVGILVLVCVVGDNVLEVTVLSNRVRRVELAACTTARVALLTVVC